MLRRAYCLSLLMSTAAVAPISYKLQNINLAERWLGLVRAGRVSASTEHGEAYGVTEVDGDLRFFVRGATEKARKINATLAASGDGLRVATDGPFVAQLAHRARGSASRDRQRAAGTREGYRRCGSPWADWPHASLRCA